MLNVASIVAGIAVIALTLNDVFQSVVMPRATGRRYRISFYVWRATWYCWPSARLALFTPAMPTRREEFLAVFAPLHADR